MITVLTEGDGFVAVDKPPGRIVVPGRGSAATELTLRAELEQQLGRPLWVVHRLDRGTSGALLFATNADAHRALSMAFERNRVAKRYWALCQGTLVGSGEVDRALIPIRGGRVRVAKVGESGGKASRTRWRALERLGDLTAVEIQPESGRLHQVRAHLAAIGHPLAVDSSYGGLERLVVPGSDSDVPAILNRTPLHAAALKFPSPKGGHSITVEAPLATDLARLCEALRASSA